MKYSAVVQADSSAVGSAANNMGTQCGTGVVASCRAGMVSMQVQTQAFQADLAPLAVPACLKTADAEIRLGLASYLLGTQLGIQGVDALDSGLITQGGTKISEGTDHITRANSLLLQATC